MTFREHRCLFTALVARLLVAINERQWSHGLVQVACDEWTVHSPRKTRLADGSVVQARDGVHKTGSRHHDGLAVDLLVYVNGKYVADGGHPIWREIDEMARGLDSRLSLGIEFRDSNHLSWME